jgi:hypothetical protein
MAEQVTTSLFLLVACVDELRVMALFAKSFRREWREIWVRESGIGLVKELSESFFLFSMVSMASFSKTTTCGKTTRPT